MIYAIEYSTIVIVVGGILNRQCPTKIVFMIIIALSVAMRDFMAWCRLWTMKGNADKPMNSPQRTLSFADKHHDTIAL